MLQSLPPVPESEGVFSGTLHIDETRVSQWSSESGGTKISFGSGLKDRVFDPWEDETEFVLPTLPCLFGPTPQGQIGCFLTHPPG